MKDEDLLEKYQNTINGYIEKGHAKERWIPLAEGI